MKPLKLTKIRQLISNSDMEVLHERVGRGKEVEAQILEIVHLDIAEWTNGGKTLFHAAGEAGNLKALQQLMSKVNPLYKHRCVDTHVCILKKYPKFGAPH